MVMNLFSIFDPSTCTTLNMNWLALIFIFIFFPASYWFSPSRAHSTLVSMSNSLHLEFCSMTLKSFTSLMIISFFFMILLNNMLGLNPLVFTATTDLLTNLTFSLLVWIGVMFMFTTINFSIFLPNQMPNMTPHSYPL